MNVNQSNLNIEYREILKSVFGNQITLADKFLNSKAVIKHHCKNCGRTFFSRPQWLVSGKDPHQCYANASESPSGKKKVTGSKKGNSTQKKVTEAMKAEMIQLYEEGNSLKSISRQFSVTPPTVKKYVQQKVN